MTEHRGREAAGVLFLTTDEVRGLLPQREPFLFVNGPAEVIPGVAMTAHTTFPENMPLYRGHFPGSPVTPGTIIVETMAQAVSLIMLATSQYEGQIGYLVGIREAHFLKPVYPGAAVLVEGNVCSQRHGVIEAAVQLSVGGVRSATAVLTVMFRPARDERRQEGMLA